MSDYESAHEDEDEFFDAAEKDETCSKNPSEKKNHRESNHNSDETNGAMLDPAFIGDKPSDDVDFAHLDKFETSCTVDDPPESDIVDADKDILKERECLENALTEEERESRRSEAQEKKVRGNQLYQEEQFQKSIDEYTVALLLAPLCFHKDRSIMFSNRAACHVKMDLKEKALADCTSALELQPDYIKCLQRRAEVHESLDKLTESLEDYKRLLQLDPGNMRARSACATLPDRITAQQEKMKAEMMGQLKQLGNMILKPFGMSTDNFQMVQDPTSGGYSVNFKK